MGAETALALGIATLVGGAFAGGKAIADGGKKKESGSSQPVSAPAAPSIGDAEASAKQKILARKKSNTILTNPYGVDAPANVKKPVLLGSGAGNDTLG